MAAEVDLGSPSGPMLNLNFLENPVNYGADQGGSEDHMIIEHRLCSQQDLKQKRNKEFENKGT